MFRFSIIVPTYNSPINKIFLTLESIIRQTFGNFEIIISDDGSEEDSFGEIESYLRNRSFTNYSFIKHEKNKGTVKNMQHAYLNCNGEYIKGLGPGDLLYSENTLTKLSEFLDLRNSNFAFGRLKSYYLINNIVKYHEFVAPPNYLINSYENKEKAFKNIFEKKTYISGASMVFKKDYIIQKKFQLDNVKYCEDLVQALVVFNEETIDFYNENIIWYEYGDGISTNGNQSFKLKEDHMNFYSSLCTQYPKNNIIKKAFCDEKLNNIKNPIKRKILKIIRDPKQCVYYIETNLNKKNTNSEQGEIGFLIENQRPFL